ncbi:MAG: lipid II flippase MurJ [bacterium]
MDVPPSLGKPEHLRSASVALLAIGIVSLGLRFVSVAVVAARFGAGPETDAFFLAQLLPVLLGFHSRSILHLCLVPRFVATRDNEGQPEAWRLASSVASFALGVLGVVAIGYALAVPFARAWVPSLAGEAGSHFVRMSRIAAPVLVLFPAFAIAEAVLYSHGRYTSTAIATLFPSLGLIAGVLLLGPRIGIEGAAWGVVGGYALQALAVLPRLLPHRRDLRIGVDWRDDSFQAVLRQIAPTTAFSLAVVTGFGIASALASHLGAGRVAAFRYGTSVLAVIPTLVQGSLVSPLYPRMAALVAAGDLARLRLLVVSFVRIASVALAPLIVLVIVLRAPLVGALFERGRFSAESTRLTGDVVLGFAPWIAAIVLNQVPTYLAMSMGEARRLAALAFALLPPMTLLGYGLAERWDVGGIAFAFSVNAWISFPLLVMLLRRRLGRLGLARLVRASARPWLAATAMGAALVPIEEHASAWITSHAAATALSAESASVLRLAELVALGVLGVLVDLGLARLFGVPEIRRLLEWLRAAPVPATGPTPAADAARAAEPGRERRTPPVPTRDRDGERDPSPRAVEPRPLAAAGARS